MSVIVCHPGTQHSLRLAVACQKAGTLEAYVTRMYWDERRFPYRALAHLPIIGPRAHKLLARRRSEELDPNRIIDISPWTEFALYGLKQARLRRTREMAMFASQRLFSRRIAKIARMRAKVIVSYDTTSYDAFRSLQGTRVARVLDLSHPHVQGDAILRDEREREPQWARTSDAPTDPRVIRRCLAEERLADHVIVASSFSRECLIRDGVPPANISVVPYGVDLSRFRPAPIHQAGAPLRLLFVGQVGLRKGIHHLLQAMNRIGDRRVELTVAGALMGDPSFIRSHSSERVRFTGRVDEARLEQLFSGSDVFVFPSLVEGFGLVLLEALASGLPIIATRHTAGPDLITHGEQGLIVPVRDPDALARAIATLHDDRKLLQSMRKAARPLAESFPWTRYEHAVSSVLRTYVER